METRIPDTSSENNTSPGNMEVTIDKPILPAINITPKTGDELMSSQDEPVAKLIDFWKWYASDIVSNATRGSLAEFIVATSIGIDLANSVRMEWDDYDLISPEGIRIEVKSGAYIQSWEQKDYSRINFSIKESHSWSSEVRAQEEVPVRHSDVYVFCLLKHRDQDTLNPLNLDQWEFVVLPTAQVNSSFQGYKTIALSSLLKLTESVSYGKLREAILQKAVIHFIKEKK